MCFQETSVFKYMFYAQKENNERKQKHHNEYKNCRTLPSLFLLCDCQKKVWKILIRICVLRVKAGTPLKVICRFSASYTAVAKRTPVSRILNGSNPYFLNLESPVIAG